MGDYESIIQLINNLGFPIAISIYLLIRLEKKIVSLEQAIQALSNVIENVRSK